MTISDFIFGLPLTLRNLAVAIRNFMTYTIDFGDAQVSAWALIGGAGLAVVVVFSILRG